MMKKNILRLGIALSASLFVLSGCSDQFLKDKDNYKQTTDAIYNDYDGAKGRIDNIYMLLLPSANTKVSYQYPSSGLADDMSQATEEYGGLSWFVDSEKIITTNEVADFFYNEGKANNNPYGFIRNCNDAIAGITAGSLPDPQKNELLGQAYFFRAWAYYRLVKVYGGVPLVDKVQDIVIGEDEGLSLAVPRSTTKATIDFICNDLDKANEMLAEANMTGKSYGRVTAGTALALKGRVLLLYASPLFNRTDDKQRWIDAYNANKAARETLTTREGKGLAKPSVKGGKENAASWGAMFGEFMSSEAVFVTLYNNKKEAGNTSLNKNNGWEGGVRPLNALGGGGKTATANMVDLFPMADGKKPGKSTLYPYSLKDPKDENSKGEQLFMLNRDPRFYRTFGFVGTQWAFSGDPTTLNKTDKFPPYPYTGASYELWNYTWYDTKDNRESIAVSGFGADGLGKDVKGIYVRKRSDDFSLNSPLYVYDSNQKDGFKWSGAPYMEMRYAEVLLNLAEAACGAGHGGDAVDILKEIRERVGYTGDCGLDADLSTNRAKLFEAVLYERQIELAYEGKRYDDMQRWMLWDGGAVRVKDQPATWNLTGFGGNTCTYLGVKPFNGTVRSTIELRVADDVKGSISAWESDKDPLINERPTAWDLAKENKPSDELVEFYETKLTRKDIILDDASGKKELLYQPHFYLLGLKASAQRNNVTLEQTIGWLDTQKNAPGTFDPLAE